MTALQVPEIYLLTLLDGEQVEVRASDFEFRQGSWYVAGKPVNLWGYTVTAWRDA